MSRILELGSAVRRERVILDSHWQVGHEVFSRRNKNQGIVIYDSNVIILPTPFSSPPNGTRSPPAGQT